MQDPISYPVLPTEFTLYVIPDKDAIDAQKLTITQRALIANQITTLMQKKLVLKYDVSNPNSFVQEEAYLRGQIDNLRYQLECSEAAYSNSIEA